MSIKEDRWITFGIATLREGVQAHMPELAPDIVPPGAEVKGVAILTEPTRLRIRFMKKGAMEAAEKELNEQYVAAILMRLCRTRRVPLPRAATKRLEADPNSVTLVVSMTHEPPGMSHLSTHRVSA